MDAETELFKRRWEHSEELRNGLHAMIVRLQRALRSADCPAGGWNGMPKDLEPTVGACVDHGVCGCCLGAPFRVNETSAKVLGETK